VLFEASFSLGGVLRLGSGRIDLRLDQLILFDFLITKHFIFLINY
jgi:hypothetical protein